MSLVQEFVLLAGQAGANRAELCRRFGISRQTGYKWLRRFAADGTAGLVPRRPGPAQSPHRVAPAMEAAVLALRAEHPAWGGRKLRARLLAQDLPPWAGPVPAASTITEILRRHDLLAEALAPHAFTRFEAAAPNDLWQMDFKGHVALDGRTDGRGERCHPLTILDDHSRFSLAVEACGDEREVTVRERLTKVFRRYGKPRRILVDNGPPWGVPGACRALSTLEVWLMRHGIAVSHSRPLHPQTLGKDERFHRTLGREALQDRTFADLAACQRHLDRFRETYNHERPHHALGLAVPASRYQMSKRSFSETLQPIVYGRDDRLRKVRNDGYIKIKGHAYPLGLALAHQIVALRPTTTDGVLDVWLSSFKLGQIDLRQSSNNPSKPVNPSPEHLSA
jgi:transposase InsO family protein